MAAELIFPHRFGPRPGDNGDVDDTVSGTIGALPVTVGPFDGILTGTVYADTNNNGRYDPGEPTFAGIPVNSNIGVGITDADGRYRLTYTFNGSSSNTTVLLPGQSLGLGNGQLLSQINIPLSAIENKQNGTVIGTAGSYNNLGNTIAKAFDGNLSNYFDGPTANGDWAGLDLGEPELITQIAYDPRSGYASRMVGGIFQGSNSPDFSNAVTLYTIITAPTNGVLTYAYVHNATPYQYVRYLAPNGSWGDVGELAFYGVAPVLAAVDSSNDLVITGTPGNDTITLNAYLQQTDYGYTSNYNVSINGIYPSIQTADVYRVIINTFDGNDSVSITGYAENGLTRSVPTPQAFQFIVNLGSGNDTVNTNLDDSGYSDLLPDPNLFGPGTTVTGGDGNDVIALQGGEIDYVKLGNGNDSAAAAAEVDSVYATLIAGNGNDTLASGSSGGSSSVDATLTAGNGQDYFDNGDTDDSISGSGGGQAFSLGYQANTVTVTGIAYIDQNHDSKYDPGEPTVPFAQINTSSGVVTADAKGRYTAVFPILADQTINVQVGPYALSLYSPGVLTGFNIAVSAK